MRIESSSPANSNPSLDPFVIAMDNLQNYANSTNDSTLKNVLTAACNALDVARGVMDQNDSGGCNVYLREIKFSIENNMTDFQYPPQTNVTGLASLLHYLSVAPPALPMGDQDSSATLAPLASQKNPSFFSADYSNFKVLPPLDLPADVNSIAWAQKALSVCNHFGPFEYSGVPPAVAISFAADAFGSPFDPALISDGSPAEFNSIMPQLFASSDTSQAYPSNLEPYAAMAQLFSGSSQPKLSNSGPLELFVIGSALESGLVSIPNIPSWNTMSDSQQMFWENMTGVVPGMNSSPTYNKADSSEMASCLKKIADHFASPADKTALLSLVSQIGNTPCKPTEGLSPGWVSLLQQIGVFTK